MFGLLLLAFVVVPLIEIYVIIQVGGSIGAGWTIFLLVFDSIIGAWLVRREGGGVMRRVRASLGQGTVPSNEVVDGLLILVAGALMLTPGFVTDVIGFLFLLPPTRAIVRNLLMRRYRKRVSTFFGGAATGAAGGAAAAGHRRGGFRRGGFIDIDIVDLTRNPDPGPESDRILGDGDDA